MRSVLVGLATVIIVAGLAPANSLAGVPRACVHPRASAIECTLAEREQRLDVLPAARVRELRRQQIEFEAEIPLEDAERNRLLREIRDSLEAR